MPDLANPGLHHTAMSIHPRPCLSAPAGCAALPFVLILRFALAVQAAGGHGAPPYISASPIGRGGTGGCLTCT